MLFSSRRLSWCLSYYFYSIRFLQSRANISAFFLYFQLRELFVFYLFMSNTLIIEIFLNFNLIKKFWSVFEKI